jgi:hypothetical protein
MIDFWTPLKIIPHVGIFAIGDFLYHMVNMAWFASKTKSIDITDTNNLSKGELFKKKRQLEQWKFGSGLDYYDHN